MLIRVMIDLNVVIKEKKITREIIYYSYTMNGTKILHQSQTRQMDESIYYL